MSKKILFSAVSRSEPISSANLYDGGMFHICRNYKPDVVYLYSTKDMLDKQINENCKTCIKRLSEKIGKEIKVVEINKDCVKNADDFNYFLEDFEKHINKIIETMSSDDDLLLNVTSGTAAMVSALTTLKMYKFNKAKFIHVKPPQSDERGFKEQSVEELWNNCKDNKNDNVRCEEIFIPEYKKLWLKDTIKSYIEKYNYTAAYELANDNAYKVFSKDYINYLKIANSRNKLVLEKFKDVEKDLDNIVLDDIFPVKNKSFKCFEYILSLDIKLKRKELADFIRALSPIFFDLLVKTVKKYGFDLNKYMEKDRYRWSIEELKKDKKLFELITGKYVEKYDKYRYEYITHEHLISILEKHIKPTLQYEEITLFNKDLELIKELRRIEYKVRNQVAHQITVVTEELIKDKVKMKTEDIYKILKDLFISVFSKNNKLDEQVWYCYDKMNQWIKDKIDNK